MNKVLRFMLLSFNLVFMFFMFDVGIDALKLPKDTVSIKVLSTGTHERGKESFISAKNGYKVGDNSVHDDVVTSGDYVKYQVDLNIAAGPGRYLDLKFENSGYHLDMSGLSNLSLSSSFIRSYYYGNTWEYYIPRGVSLKLSGQFSLVAKDTNGSIKRGNAIKAILLNDSSNERDRLTSFSVAKPITVVSAPLADLSLDTNIYSSRLYNQSDEYGYFNIVPIPIKVDGYDSQGITSNGDWHTDLDVSDFPDGTEWWVGGREEIPSDGKLVDLKGSGTTTIKYKLPDDYKPTESMPFKSYFVHILPYDDSFKVGDSNNIEDIGLNKHSNFSTAISTYKGNKIYSLEGYSFKNNNYAGCVWRYVKPPSTGLIPKKFWFNLCLPRRYDKLLFDEENVHFNNLTPYYMQGVYGDRGFYVQATTDNDFYGRLVINTSRIDSDNKNLVIGGRLYNDAKHINAKFDTQRDVVIKFDDKVVDANSYSVYWRHSDNDYLGDNVSNWVESSKPLGGDYNQYKIVFKNNRYKDVDRIYVYTPMKTLPTYKKEDIIGKRIYVSALVAEASNYNMSSNNYEYDNLFISLPQIPELISKLVKHEEPILNQDTKRFKVNFKTDDRILNAYTTKGYKIIRKFTIPEVYDISTFKYDDKDYKMSVKGREITLTKDGDSIGDSDYSNLMITPLKLSIETESNLKSFNINGNIEEEVKLKYPGYGNIKKGELKNTVTCNYSFTGSEELGTQLTSVRKTDNNIVEFDYKVVLGGSVKKDFSITLPYIGDGENIEEVNKYNGTSISLNENGVDTSDTMDGFGSSKFEGKYKIKKVDVSNIEFAKNYNIINNLNSNLFVKNDKGVSFLGNNDKFGDSKVSMKFNKDNYNFIKESSDSFRNKVIDIKVELEFDDLKKGQHVVSYISKLDNVKNISWPDYVEGVKSSIEGRVVLDNNNNSLVDDSDRGLQNIEVNLYRDGNKVRSINTNSNGEYLFDDLTHGNYEVRLDKVKRHVGIDNYIDSSETNLASKKANRFGVLEKTIQTIGNGYYDYIDTKFPISLKIDSQVKDKDFGFFIPESDVALDVKSVNNVYNNSYANIEYDVEVKNTGNTALNGLKLTDVVSNDLSDVNYSIDYKEVKDDLKGQKILKIIGKEPNRAGGSAVLTDKGYYLVNYHWPNKYKVFPLSGIEGRITQIVGDYPASDTMGSAIATNKDYYLIDWNNGKPKSIKVNGIDGNIKQIIGREPLSVTDGSAIATDKGYYIVRYNRNTNDIKVVKVDGIDGNIKQIIGYSPASDLYGSGVVTDKGYYVVDYNDGNPKVFKADEVEGSIKQVVGYWPMKSSSGSAVLTDKSCYVIRYTDSGLNSFKLLDGENIKYITGRSPLDSDSGLGLATDTTFYVWNTRSGVADTEYERGVNIEGNVKAIVGDVPSSYYGGLSIVTDKGYYRAKLDSGRYYFTMFVQKLKGIEGDFREILGEMPNDSGASGSSILTSKGLYLDFTYNESHILEISELGSSVHEVFSSESPLPVSTDKGYYLIDRDFQDHTTRIIKVGYSEKTLSDQALSSVSTDVGETTTSRAFDLPELAPGDKITIHVKGKAIKKESPYLIGHQAYVTSPQTPRSGITTSKVTGTNKQPGVPDDFVLPSLEDYDPVGIKGNPTVMLNSSIDSDGDYGSNSIATDPNNPKDDLADQVATRIDPLPEGTKVVFGDIGGKAFLDLDNDNLYTSKDKLLPNIHVTLEDEDGEVIKDTYTDNNGSYLFKSIPDTSSYKIHFDILGVKVDNKPVTTLDVSNKTDNDNDTDPSGYVVNSIKPKDTPTIGKSDLGVKFVESSIQVIKGQTKNDVHKNIGEYELLDSSPLTNQDIDLTSINTDSSLDDGDNDPRTNYYSFKIINNGQSDISNINVKDTTLEGNTAKLYPKALYYKDANSKPEQISISANGTIDQTMVPGSYIVGAFGFSYDKAHIVHKDSVKVSGGVMSRGMVVGDVSDTDTFTSSYEYQGNKNLHIDVYGVKNLEDKNNREDLHFIALKIYKKVGSGYKPLGTYNTSLGGLDMLLGDGEYKIVQVNTAMGYVLPADDGWIVTLNRHDNKLSTKINASNLMPYSEVLGGSDWGKVNLYNYRSQEIPLTGGNLLFIEVNALLATLLGISYIYIKNKKLKER